MMINHIEVHIPTSMAIAFLDGDRTLLVAFPEWTATRMDEIAAIVAGNDAWGAEGDAFFYSNAGNVLPMPAKPDSDYTWDQATESWLLLQPAIDARANAARSKRSGLINGSEWLMARHRDEIDRGVATTLTAAQFTALLDYRQVLRDLPSQPGFPLDITWPTSPV